MLANCPRTERLEQMLADALTADDAAAVESHVSGCTHCQEELERLTAGLERTERTWVAPVSADAGDALETMDQPDRTARMVVGPRVSAGMSSRPEPPGYLIERELGRGGMGVVYLARQIRANRLVALKMVLAGSARSEDLLRFHLEGESLARLHHPNIVQVYEVGDADGQPFFSMEYVGGGTLAEKLAEARCGVREAAELVRTLALGVHAAHQCGVVHRDLKPANILLKRESATTGPILKITDFGLAKAIGMDSGLTGTGQILGTPSYMAPEQATSGATVGVPADVYALGAILYEALTGRPPFRGESAWETLMQAVHEPVTAPSRWRANVPRDLEVICLKCLSKDASARYASADALAEDLRRFLADESILARPASVSRIAWLWCRRHPGFAAMLGLLFLSMAGGVLGVGIQWRRAEANLAESHRRLDLAMRAVETYYTGASRDVLLKQPGMASLRAALLQTPLEFYRSLRDEIGAGRQADPETLAQLGDVLFNLGKLNGEVGREADAIAAYREAAGIARENAQRNDSGPARRTLGKSLLQIGEIDLAASRYEEARAALGEALSVYEKLGGKSSRDPVSIRGQAGCLLTMGDVDCDEKQFERSEQDYVRGLGLLEQLLKDYPDDIEALDKLGASQNNVAILYARWQRTEDAGVWFGKSLETRRRLIEKRPETPEYRRKLSSSLNNLGSFCHNTNRLGEVASYHEEARKIQEGLVRDYPTVALFQEDLATTYQNIAYYHTTIARHDLARQELRKAIDTQERLAREHPDSVDYGGRMVAARTELGRAYLNEHEDEAALGELTRGVSEAERLVAAHPKSNDVRLRLADTRGALAECYQSMGMLERAERTYRLAVATFRELTVDAPATSDETFEGARCELNLAQLRIKLGELDLAESDTRRVMTAMEQPYAKTISRCQLMVASCDVSLGDIGLRRLWLDRDLSHAERAVGDFGRAAEIAAALVQVEPTDENAKIVLASARAGRASALGLLKHYPEAIAEWDRAVADAPGAGRNALVLGRAATLCWAGRVAEGLKVVAGIAAGTVTDEDVMGVARVYAVAGGSNPAIEENAISLLRRAAVGPTRGDGRGLAQQLLDPAFDSVRGRAEFQAIASDLGFPVEVFGP